MGNTGKLLGPARTTIIYNLDGIFIYLMVLQQNMNEQLDTIFLTEIMNTFEKKVHFETHFNKYHSSGTLLEEDINKVKSFIPVFNEKILNRIKEIVWHFRNITESKESKEKIKASIISLYYIFDITFYNLLILRYCLENVLIDK